MSIKKSALAICASSLLMAGLVSAPSHASTEPFIGEIMQVGFNFAPRGWAHCDGQLLPISQNTALFSLLGTTYGGDGRSTFALPDMRGRVAIHRGNGPGLSNYTIGARGGAEVVTLSVGQMPAHSHTVTVNIDNLDVTLKAYDGEGDSASPDGSVLAQKRRTDIYSSEAPDVSMSSSSVDVSGTVTAQALSAGGNQAHENRMPYIVINHVIALVGIFPSRS